MQVTTVKIQSQINLRHLFINHGVKNHNREFIGEVEYPAPKIKLTPI